MENSISFLIGSGFSAPMGYPVSKTLNELLLNSKNENIGFHMSGSLIEKPVALTIVGQIILTTKSRS
jgi:hypothetical protein